VLRQDDIAHAVYGLDEDLYSYILFSPGVTTELPHIDRASQPLNIMLKEQGAGRIELAIADPVIGLNRQDGGNKKSPIREVRIHLSHKNCRLVGAQSGLPQTNPPLDAQIVGAEKDTLIYQTRNGVTDSFVIAY